MVADVFLFGLNTVLGIIGIVLMLVLPGLFIHRAIVNANGVFDRIFAKFIAPALVLIGGALTLLAIFFWLK